MMFSYSKTGSTVQPLSKKAYSCSSRFLGYTWARARLSFTYFFFLGDSLARSAAAALDSYLGFLGFTVGSTPAFYAYAALPLSAV
jgi:hypothetical protein